MYTPPRREYILHIYYLHFSLLDSTEAFQLVRTFQATLHWPAANIWWSPHIYIAFPKIFGYGKYIYTISDSHSKNFWMWEIITYKQNIVIILTEYYTTIEYYALYYKCNQWYEKNFLTTIYCITWVRVICLKYTHLHLGPMGPHARAYISGKSLMPML